MPINLVAKAAGNAGVVSPTLGDAAVNFDGTFVNPASIAGSINANLGQSDADFVGLFTQLPNRTGTIATTLSGVTSAITNASVENNATRIDSFLSTRTVPFSYSTPIDPSTVGQTTITISSGDSTGSFATAVAQSNVLVNVGAGYTGSGASSWGNDVDVVMSNTATITSAIAFGSAQRIRWTGGNIDTPASASPALTLDAGSDILIDNLLLKANGTAFNTPMMNLNVASNAFTRVAFINTTFEQTGAGEYSIFTRGASGSIRNGDLILANCRGLQTDKATRIQGHETLIVVDSVFLGFVVVGSGGATLTSGTSGSGFRVHERTGALNGVFFDGVITTGTNNWGDNGSGLVPSVMNATINNFHVYHSGSQAFMVGNSNSGTITNSTTHSTLTSSPTGIIGIDNFIDAGGNQTVPWDGAGGSINYSIGIPGKTTISDYGADH